jgi:hypothetical protein
MIDRVYFNIFQFLLLLPALTSPRFENHLAVDANLLYKPVYTGANICGATG